MSKFLLILAVLLMFSGTVESFQMDKHFTGTWDGFLGDEKDELGFSLTFYRNELGDLIGEITIPHLDLTDTRLITTSYYYPNFYLELYFKNYYGVFSGQITTDDVIEGTYRFNGGAGNFMATRVTDKPRFTLTDKHFTREEFEISLDSHTIYGELLLPQKESKKTLIIIAPRSGPVDRDGNNLSIPGRNDSYKMLAQALYNEGISTLRYDKRGSGKSLLHGSRITDYTFDDFVDDHAAIIRKLKQDKRFDKIVLLGHGEGGLISLINSGNLSVNALITIAAPGRPFSEVIYTQLNEMGFDMDQISKIIDSLKQGNHVRDLPASLEPIFSDSFQPFLISLFQYDPADLISGLEIPIMVAHGKSDIQMPVEHAQYLHEYNPSAELAIIDDMNNILKKVAEFDYEMNGTSHYNPRIPLADDLVPRIVNFINSIK